MSWKKINTRRIENESGDTITKCISQVGTAKYVIFLKGDKTPLDMTYYNCAKDAQDVVEGIRNE